MRRLKAGGFEIVSEADAVFELSLESVPCRLRDQTVRWDGVTRRLRVVRAERTNADWGKSVHRRRTPLSPPSDATYRGEVSCLSERVRLRDVSGVAFDSRGGLALPFDAYESPPRLLERTTVLDVAAHADEGVAIALHLLVPSPPSGSRGGA